MHFASSAVLLFGMATKIKISDQQPLNMVRWPKSGLSLQFSYWLFIFWKQFPHPDMDIILDTQGRGGGGNCKIWFFVLLSWGQIQLRTNSAQMKMRWGAINSSIRTTKQVVGVFTNRWMHEYGFPKYRNTEIQESECGSGARWLGNTETRNVWQPPLS